MVTIEQQKRENKIASGEKKEKEQKIKEVTSFGIVLRKLKRQPISIIGIFMVLVATFFAIFAYTLAPHDPFEIDLSKRMLPPSSEHWLGTDQMGRDLVSRILVGFRTSLTVGLATAALSGGIGLIVGLISGYFGGIIDETLMRITDTILVIPSFFLYIVAAAMFEVRGIEIIILIMGCVMWTVFARIVRSEVLSLKERTYVEAARSMGASNFRILFRHILPNALASIIVVIVLRAGQAILIEASLSFLGLSDPTACTLGSMLAIAHATLRAAWWITTFPGLAIAWIILGLNLLADGLRDALDVRL